jgi:hypothetical protein
VSKALYKVLHLLVILLSSKVVSALYRRAWRAVARGGDPPAATDAASSWPEIVAASAGYGAVLGVTKAVGDRSGATGVRKLTGRWPGTGAASKPT